MALNYLQNSTINYSILHIKYHQQIQDPNTSPVLDIFCATKSMQNAQVITQTNGCNKCVCKYVGSMDEQNYVVASTSGNKNGSLITRSTFLHYTKITSSKLNEEKNI